MAINVQRRSLLFASFFAPAVLAGKSLFAEQSQEDPSDEKVLPSKQIYQFVRMAHFNLEKTKVLLAAEPRLIRVAWEWGPGDFELGIDGAAHSGSREIVEFLVEQGAPYSAFAAATLGDLATIQAMINSHPAVATSLGAHGIPLIEHALAGGEVAESVAEFLKEQGAEPREEPKDLPTTTEYRESVVGEYHIDADGRSLDFRIYVENESLFIDAGELGVKRLQFQGQDIFQLEGTPAQLTFELDGGMAESALLREGAPIGRATRVK